MHSKSRSLLLTSAFIVLFLGVAASQNAADSLRNGFENPPESAKPRVWWHWMNGNISRVGIKLDLDWMHQVGLGGVDIIDASLSTPQVVKQRIIYMTPEWKSDFLYATRLAGQYGMQVSINSSPGWSETGGPWVAPSEGMKKYVWSKTVIEGGRPFYGKLPHPPEMTGPFQNIGTRVALSTPSGTKSTPQFYADSVVVAYRQPETDVSPPSAR